MAFSVSLGTLLFSSVKYYNLNANKFNASGFGRRAEDYLKKEIFPWRDSVCES
jgi:hypothetical protein